MNNMTITKPFAFIQRDFISDISYKFEFCTKLFWMFISTVTYFFLSKLIGDMGQGYLKPYGGNYFSFVLIGIAFYSYLGVSINGLSNTIRSGQMLGTLEALLVTQTAIPTIILSSSLYSFLWASFRVVVYLSLGAILFGLDIGNANLPAAMLILFLTVICFSSLGIIAASFIMVLKRGNPIGWAFGSVSGLLGGLYYPISVLPDWLQTLSYLLPITYSLEGMRLALLNGYPLSMLLSNVIPLFIFSIFMLPLSIMSFTYAVKKAKKDGTLTQY